MLESVGLVVICFAAAAFAGESSTGFGAQLGVAVIGDCLPGHHYNRLIGEGVDPFRNLRPVLASADLAAANLECPLTERGSPVPGKRFVFRGAPRHAELLADAGIDVLGLANNHVMDYGDQGLADTIASLSRAGLFWCGAGKNAAEARRPASLVAGNQRIAFLAYNRTLPKSYWAQDSRPGTAFAAETHVRADVAAARSSHDVVIVMLHGGRERASELRAYQALIARAAIESGAALFVGSHPHVVQGVQKIGEGIAAYSLGDALFGGAWSRKEDGLLLRARFVSTRLRSVELLALNASIAATGGIPVIRSGDSAIAILKQVRALSSELGTELELGHSSEGWPCARIDLGFERIDPGGAPAAGLPDQENGQDREQREPE